jgi:hypothetical protein
VDEWVVNEVVGERRMKKHVIGALPLCPAFERLFYIFLDVLHLLNLLVVFHLNYGQSSPASKGSFVHI